MTINQFREKIKSKNVEGNRTYLSIWIDGCKYGQSYQNTVNTLEGMKNKFVMFYYPLAIESKRKSY